MRFDKWLITSAVLLISLAAHAQQPAAGQPQANRSEVLIRTYNAADLMRLTTDYPLSTALRRSLQLGEEEGLGAQGGGGGGGGGQIFGSTGARRGGPVVDAGPLIRLLLNTIDPTSWKNNGGEIGTVSEIRSTLVITQTRANHELIQTVLDEVRRHSGPTQVLTIRTTWVQAAPGQLPAIGADVTPDWIAKQKLYCESQITCFSGQTVHLSSGTGKKQVEDLTPIVGTNAVAFDPQVQTVIGGVALQLAPQLIPGNESAILDVQAAVSELAQQDEKAEVSAIAQPERGPDAKTTAFIDRTKVVRQEFQTTARVPLRKKVIIGGMTLEPASAEQAGRQLYLVVEIDTVK